MNVMQKTQSNTTPIAAQQIDEYLKNNVVDDKLKELLIVCRSTIIGQNSLVERLQQINKRLGNGS